MTLVSVENRHITINNGIGAQQPSFAPMFMMPMYNLFGAIFNRMVGSCFGGYNQNIFANQMYSGGTYVAPLPTTYRTQFNMNPYYTPAQTNMGVGDYFVHQQINTPATTSYGGGLSLNNTYVGHMNFNRDYSNFTPTYIEAKRGASSVSGASQVSGASSLTNTRFGKKDLNFWRSLGYNPEKGQQLVENAKHSRYRGARHQCVAVVRESINDTYYGGQEHYTRFGKACNIGDQFLSNDSHFRKIIPDWDVSPDDFPPGAIIVYNGDNGNGGYVRGDDRGHGEIAYGDGSGKGISNYDLTIKPQHIKEVWIPV